MLTGSSEDGNWDKAISAVGRGQASWQKGLSRICGRATNYRVEEGSCRHGGSEDQLHFLTAFWRRVVLGGKLFLEKEKVPEEKESAKNQESRWETSSRKGRSYSGQQPQVELPKSAWKQRPALKRAHTRTSALCLVGHMWTFPKHNLQARLRIFLRNRFQGLLKREKKILPQDVASPRHCPRSPEYQCSIWLTSCSLEDYQLACMTFFFLLWGCYSSPVALNPGFRTGSIIYNHQHSMKTWNPWFKKLRTLTAMAEHLNA